MRKILSNFEAVKKLKDKFGSEIELLEEYKGWEVKHRFFCHRRDPITGEEHGEFIKIFGGLFSKDCHGCQECSNLFYEGKWKFSFFQRINELYPGQKFDFLGVKDISIKYPRSRDKFRFRCLKCGHEFILDAHQILSSKIHHNKDRILCSWCSKNKPRIYTEELCLEKALLCKSKSEFQDKYPGEYESSRRHGYLKSYTWMKPPKKIFKTLDLKDKSYYVYIYDFSTFPGKEVYIGLSNIEGQNREYGHRTLRISPRTGKDISSPVRKTAIKYGLNLDKKEEMNYHSVLETGLNYEEAQEKEDYYVNKYKELGFTVLNKAKTGIGSGSLGGAIKKWDTLEKCINAVLEKKELGWSYKEVSIHLNAPLKKISLAGKLDDIWPERRIKHKFLIDDFRKTCKELKEFHPKDYMSTEDFKKIYKYIRQLSIKRPGNEEKQILLKNILWEELSVLYPLHNEGGILVFNKLGELTNIFSSAYEAATFFGKSHVTIKDYIHNRYKSDDESIFRRELTWLKNDFQNLNKEEKEKFKKKYIDLGGKLYKENY